MTVGKYCNREVYVALPDTSILELAKLMREYHVGDIIVVEQLGEKRMPVGIVTDRDLVVEVLAQGVDMNAVVARDVMSSELVTVNEQDALLDALETMRSNGVRRVPVVSKGGNLEGILTVADAIELINEASSQLSQIIRKGFEREKREHP